MKTILVDAYFTLVLPDVGMFWEMHELLETYPHTKIVLTNATVQKQQHLLIDTVPYQIFSLSHNPNKRDPAYYHTCLAQFWLQTTDVIYFEHNAEAVDSARSVGITTYHYDKDTKDLKSLKEFLDANL